MALLFATDRPSIMSDKNHCTAIIAALFFSCLIIGNLMISGCATPQKTGPAPYPPMSPDIISMKILSAETALLRTPRDNSGKAEKADFLLRLAMLHAHPDNPDQNYQRAIKYLEQYLKLGQTVNARYTLSLLTRLSECVSGRAKDSACDKLKKENKELEKSCQDLTKENLYHKQIIEKLKSLDIQLEKKRKSFD